MGILQPWSRVDQRPLGLDFLCRPNGLLGQKLSVSYRYSTLTSNLDRTFFMKDVMNIKGQCCALALH